MANSMQYFDQNTQLLSNSLFYWMTTKHLYVVWARNSDWIPV